MDRSKFIALRLEGGDRLILNTSDISSAFWKEGSTFCYTTVHGVVNDYYVDLALTIRDWLFLEERHAEKIRTENIGFEDAAREFITNEIILAHR